MIGCKLLTEEEKNSILSSLPDGRDKFLFTLGLATGFRISELLSVKIDDCMQHGRVLSHIRVNKRATKGKMSSRSIPINPSTQVALFAYISSLPLHQIYLFESKKRNRLSRIQAWRIIKSVANVLEISGKVATHSMRKYYANKIYNLSGKDLVLTQKALGHASVNSTISYLQSDKEDVDNVILKAQG